MAPGGSVTTLPPGNYKVVLASPNLASRLEFTIEVSGHAIDSLVGTVPTAAIIHSPMEPLEGFNATYYDISNLPTIPDAGDVLEYGQVISSRIDSRIDFTNNPYYGGSSWNLPRTDRFVAIYRGFLYMKSSGTCSFNVVVDDSMIIYVDGEEVLRSWTLQPLTSYVAKVPLSPGLHNITTCYFENYGTARLRAVIIVEEQLSKLIRLSIYGKYFNTHGANPSQPDPSEVLNDELHMIHEGYEERIDYIDLSYYELTHGGEPWPFQDGAPNPSTSTAHWVTDATVLKADKYLIKTQNDDGIKVLIDGSVILEDWDLHSPRSSSASVYLSAGKHSLKVVYFERTGIARLKVGMEARYETEKIYPDTGGYLVIEIQNLNSGRLPSRFHVTVIDAESGSVIGDVAITVPSNASTSYSIKVRVRKELPLPGAVAIWR